MASGYAALYAEVGAVLEDGLGRLLGGLVDSPAGREGSAAQVLIDQELQRFYSQYRLLQQRHRDQTLSVAVLALTKSGKSTLLNALMGRVILPSNNVPETARISCITHTALAANEQPLLVVNGTSHYGDSNIRAQLQYLNQEVRLRAHRQSDEAFLDIRAPVAALSASESTPGVAFRLLDTPGPNEAGEEALKFQVERLLDGVDAVIYLLDYTKLKTQEEADTLRKLQDINPQLVKRLSQRLFFVVNKADQIGHTEGMEAEETRQYVADLVTRQMDCEDFQLDPDQVLLLSAQDALLSRLLLAGNPSPADKDRFLRIAFGKKAAKMASAEAECRKAAVEILEESGLPELESQVLGFLYTHSGALKLLAVLDDMAHMLHQVQNVAAASNAALRQDVASLQSEADVLQHQLERTLMQFEDISREAEQVEVEVVDEVQARMQRLKEHLFQHVSAVLDVTADPETVLPPARAGRWRAVWNKAVHFLSRAPQTPEQGPRDMQATLEELHNEIQAQIDAEVGEFWQQLERATNERQHTLFRRINTHLQALSQRIEAAVGEVLEVRLEPAHIRLEMPSAQDFHTSLQTLFAEGITFEERQRTREVEQSAVVWEKRYRHGLCRKGEYFVGRPVSRTVTETYTECVWELQPENIKYHFITMVDQTVDNSIKHVRAFVRQYLSCQVGEARARIEDYGERYTAAMLAVVGTSRQGEEHRLRALATVGHHLATVEDLLDDVATIQDHAQRLFPAAHSTPGQAGPGSSSFMSDDSLYGSMQRSDPACPAAPAAAQAADAVHEAATGPSPQGSLVQGTDQAVPLGVPAASSVPAGEAAAHIVAVTPVPLPTPLVLQALAATGNGARAATPGGGPVPVLDMSSLCAEKDKVEVTSSGTRTPVVDVRPLAGLTAMEPLKLGETEVASVRPLARLTATESLNLGETEVANVSPLAGLTGLHTLTAAGQRQQQPSPRSPLGNPFAPGVMAVPVAVCPLPTAADADQEFAGLAAAGFASARADAAAARSSSASSKTSSKSASPRSASPIALRASPTSASSSFTSPVAVPTSPKLAPSGPTQAGVPPPAVAERSSAVEAADPVPDAGRSTVQDDFAWLASLPTVPLQLAAPAAVPVAMAVPEAPAANSTAAAVKGAAPPPAEPVNASLAASGVLPDTAADETTTSVLQDSVFVDAEEGAGSWFASPPAVEELQQADHPAVLMAEEECEIVDVVFSDASASPTGYSSDAESTGWTVVPDHEDDRM